MKLFISLLITCLFAAISQAQIVDFTQGNKKLGDIEVNSIKYTNGYWDDLRIPAAQTKRGSNSLPAYDETHMALDFVADPDTNEIAFFNVQLPHGWMNYEMHVHFHWEQTAANDTFEFHMAYRNFPIADTMQNWTYVPLDYVSSASYTSGTFHNIAAFPPITLNGNPSSFIDIKIYRYGSNGITHVYVKGVDIHYKFDEPGSLEEIPYKY